MVTLNLTNLNYKLYVCSVFGTDLVVNQTFYYSYLIHYHIMITDKTKGVYLSLIVKISYRSVRKRSDEFISKPLKIIRVRISIAFRNRLVGLKNTIIVFHQD